MSDDLRDKVAEAVRVNRSAPASRAGIFDYRTADAVLAVVDPDGTARAAVRERNAWEGIATRFREEAAALRAGVETLRDYHANTARLLHGTDYGTTHLREAERLDTLLAEHPTPEADRD